MRRVTRKMVTGWVAAVALVASGTLGSAAHAQVTHGELDQRVPITIGGRLWVDLYEPYVRADVTQPLRASMRLEGLALTLDKDGEWGGLHTDLRARESKPRRFYPSNVWFEEAYLYGRLGQTKIKVGSVYHQLGLSDNSLYGTIADHDGLTNDSDYGISAEGTVAYGTHLTFTRAVQYFVSENRLNHAFSDTLGVGRRDSEADGSAHEQRGWVLRLSPEWTRGQMSVAPGFTASTQRVELDQHALTRIGHETTVWGGDLRLRFGQGMKTLRADGEVLGRNSAGWTQRNFSTGYGVPNERYLQAGVALGSEAAGLRYTYAHKSYRGSNLREAQHQLGLKAPLGSTASLNAEYVSYRWTRSGTTTTLERSLIVRLAAGF